MWAILVVNNLTLYFISLQVKRTILEELYLSNYMCGLDCPRLDLDNKILDFELMP